MHKMDQIAAAAKRNGEFINYPNENWEKFKDSVFAKNNDRIEYLFNELGYLGINELRKSGSNDFWLFVQHCDKFPKLQKRVLTSMKIEVKKRNSNPDNYADLLDRVNANAGEKQNFETQVDYR
jgi:hypothetical protein